MRDSVLDVLNSENGNDSTSLGAEYSVSTFEYQGLQCVYYTFLHAQGGVRSRVCFPAPSRGSGPRGRAAGFDRHRPHRAPARSSNAGQAPLGAKRGQGGSYTENSVPLTPSKDLRYLPSTLPLGCLAEPAAPVSNSQTSRRTKSRGPPSARTVRWTSAQKSFQAIFSNSLRTSSQDTP